MMTFLALFVLGWTTSTTGSTCICPEVQICVPTTSSKKSKTSSTSIGCGVGNCDCDGGGMAEIRFKYTGAYNDVLIEIWWDTKYQFKVCEFDGVQSGQQIVCNLRGGTGLLVNGLYAFPNETPFRIIGTSNDYLCEAQYHTSCSKDIVGFTEIECADLIVSGWRDVNYQTDGSDCDDGVEDDCDCDNPFETVTTTTSNPVLIPVKMGDQCYCDVTGSNTYSIGNGVGDCDCDVGQREIRMLYTGTATVDIKFLYKDGTHLTNCDKTKVIQGDEVVCSILGFNYGRYESFGANTFIELLDSATGAAVCEMSVHTSCSSDIVGTYGDDGCGTEMMVSGYKDLFDLGDGCDDGLELCECDSGVYVPQDNPLITDPNDENMVQIADFCYCSTVASVSDYSTSVSGALDDSKSKTSSNDGYGIGRCECVSGTSGMGIKTLRFAFIPSDNPYEGMDIQMIIGYDSDLNNIFCVIDDVTVGEEYECSIPDPPVYRYKLDTNTYIKLVDPTTGDLLPGAQIGELHTSCSEDIIGWSAQNEENIVITGWADIYVDVDNNECDDGWEPCDCIDCSPFDVAGGADSECAKQSGCYVKENAAGDTCESLAYDIYQGSAAKEYTVFAVIAIVALSLLC